MQQLISTSEVPPGQYTFICPETKFVIKALNKNEWLQKIEAHYKANGLTLPDNWKAKVEDRLCQGLPAGWCKYVSGTPVNYGLCKVTRDKLLNGIRALATLLWDVFLGKDIYVEQQEAEARADICVRCPFNVGVEACMGCKGMEFLVNTVAKIKGDRVTANDGTLKNCCKCNCRNEAIVHIKKEILISGQSQEDLIQYPLWCWKISDSLQQAKDNLSL